MAVIARAPSLLSSAGWDDYGLLASGGGRKLERLGAWRLVRPEAQCLWRPTGEPEDWEGADATFEGEGEEEAGAWRFAREMPAAWPVSFGAVRFFGRTTAFRHLGVFPEHAAHWTWIGERLAGKREPAFKLLNLFGYTGIASLVAAAAGAQVTHVDASRRAVAWGKENAELSGLAGAPIRWICEDARRWVEREGRRGARYDGIILDPPKHGRGPAGEVWRLYEHLPTLLAGCAELLSEGAEFLILNAYSERLSAVALAGLAAEALGSRAGEIAFGDLALTDAASGRGVGLSVFARWARTS